MWRNVAWRIFPLLRSLIFLHRLCSPGLFRQLDKSDNSCPDAEVVESSPDDTPGVKEITLRANVAAAWRFVPATFHPVPYFRNRRHRVCPRYFHILCVRSCIVRYQAVRPRQKPTLYAHVLPNRREATALNCRKQFQQLPSKINGRGWIERSLSGNCNRSWFSVK